MRFDGQGLPFTLVGFGHFCGVVGGCMAGRLVLALGLRRVCRRRYGGGLDQGLEVAKLERVDFFVLV